MATLSLSYYPWITQSISGAALAQAVGKFKDLLEQEIRRRMDGTTQLILLKEMEIPEQLKELKEKPTGDLICKIGLLNPLGYALIHADAPDVEAVAVVRRKLPTGSAGPFYKAQLYANRKAAIKKDKIQDIRGRKVAFGSPQSTSNFLMPAYMLWNAGIHPLNGLSRVDFAGGHDTAAIAVYEGRSDVGAGHDGVITDLANKPGYGDADQVLTNVVWSPDIPSDPVAVHTADAAVRKHVFNALIAIAKPNDGDSEGNKAVKAFWGTSEGFDTIDPNAYAFLHGPMKLLGLRQADILRKL
jgi:ABC-type phosphate/phosphonate transport system substrate-binding protein